MKTVLILAGLVALAFGNDGPHHYPCTKKGVDTSFVEIQKKLLGLVKHVEQVDTNSLYYKTGKDYIIEDHIEDYTNKKAVEEFLQLRKTGLLPKYFEFSVFYDRMRDEAISLFHLFYYAKDFETFYKTASWARVYLNKGQFLYAFYIAVIQRPDTQGYVLPAPYEVYPKFFINLDTLTKIFRTKMQDGIIHPDEAAKHGIILENGHFYYFSNYTNTLVSNNLEQRLSYFTEDIGLNAYYYYFHSHLPFWWTSEKYGALKSRRGELYYYIYQQLITRYYFERLTNGLGEVPQFSWYSPVKSGYYALMKSAFFPFAQRPDYMNLHTEENYENIRFLNSYESSFLQFLQSGHFKAYDQKVDFHDPKAVNFVGNYWQDNADLYGEEATKDYQRSYEVVARRVLGAAPKPFDKYTFMPSPLVFYQTSLRDPMFYQLYNRILSYIVEYKQYLEPYSSEKLGFNGVKIVNVDVEKLVTFFEYYDFDAINSVFLSKDELTTGLPQKYMVRQPRINQKPFSVTINVKSEVAVDAVFKIFMAPKYDANGFPLSLEEKWNKFFELDWFTHKLTVGTNKIVKKSTDFIFFKEDSRTISEIEKMLEEGQIPEDMAANFGYLPRRLMLPKGTESGFPFELFVYVYQLNSDNKELATFEHFIQDNKPLGYPFDRPVVEDYFKQPNMYFEDVLVFHEGKKYPHQFHPNDISVTNAVPKN